MSDPEPRSRNLPHHVAALDGLRGVAVAAVVAYHVRPEWVPGGYLGVDLFFVLSGYLITSLLVDEFSRDGRIDLLAFAGRRLRRLLPAVLVVVTAVVAHQSLRGTTGDIEQIRRHALATLAYVANWAFIRDGVSYFDAFAGPSMLRHAWSLAVEEQFYLMWPLVVFVALRVGGRRAVAGAAVAIGVGSAIWITVLFEATDPSRAYFGTDTLIFEPLIGALGAVFWPLRSTKPDWLTAAGTGAGAAWLISIFIVDDQWSGFYRGGALALGILALTAVVAATGSGPLTSTARVRPLVGLGVISYGVYLWHWPLLLMLRHTGWRRGWVDVTTIVATLTVSSVSYLLIERPIRRLGRGSSTLRDRLRPVVVATASIGAVGMFVFAMTRTSVPVNAITVDQAIAAVSSSANGSPSDREGSESTDALTVVLIGDSTAWTLGGGEITPGSDHGPFASPFDPNVITLINLARKGYRLELAPPSEDRPRQASDIADEQWWIDTVREINPDLIVALFSLTDARALQTDGNGPGFDPPNPSVLGSSPGALVLERLATMAPVVLLSSPRPVAADMLDPTNAAIFETAGVALNSNLNKTLAELAAADERVGYIDFAGWMCPDDANVAGLLHGCRATAANEPFRYDGVHFSHDGAALSAEWITGSLFDEILDGSD